MSRPLHEQVIAQVRRNEAKEAAELRQRINIATQLLASGGRFDFSNAMTEAEEPVVRAACRGALLLADLLIEEASR